MEYNVHLEVAVIHLLFKRNIFKVLESNRKSALTDRSGFVGLLKVRFPLDRISHPQKDFNATLSCL